MLYHYTTLLLGNYVLLANFHGADNGIFSKIFSKLIQNMASSHETSLFNIYINEIVRLDLCSDMVMIALFLRVYVVSYVAKSLLRSTNAKIAAWILVRTVAIMSPLRSKNGPQARMAVEFLVELPKLALASRARRPQATAYSRKSQRSKNSVSFQSTVQK